MEQIVPTHNYVIAITFDSINLLRYSMEGLAPREEAGLKWVGEEEVKLKWAGEEAELT